MRIKYTDAVQCLMESESLYTEVDGAKSAFDDFAVLHHNLTPFVHNSVRSLLNTTLAAILTYILTNQQATFLTFHRYYIWALEEHLRSKCGYDGMPHPRLLSLVPSADRV